MEEIWKEIEGYEGLYEINNFGKVKSFHWGKIRIMKEGHNKKGYLIVALCKESKLKTYQVHKLVAITFLNHIPSGMKCVINHKDFNILNNNIDNLEIITNRDNANRKHLKHTSIYTGVCIAKNTNKKMWRASISINGKTKYLGSFINEYDAHLCYERNLSELKSMA